MNKASTAYITCTVSGKTYTYHFTGVISIEHNLALNLDNEAVDTVELIRVRRENENRAADAVRQ